MEGLASWLRLLKDEGGCVGHALLLGGWLVGCWADAAMGLLRLCCCCSVGLEVGPCAVCLILHQIPGSIEVVVELDVVHGGGQA